MGSAQLESSCKFLCPLLFTYYDWIVYLACRSWINRDDINFSNVEGMRPLEQFELTEEMSPNDFIALKCD